MTGNKRFRSAPKAFQRRMLSHHFRSHASSNVSAYSLQASQVHGPPFRATDARPAVPRRRQKPLFSGSAMADNNAGGSRPPQGGVPHRAKSSTTGPPKACRAGFVDHQGNSRRGLNVRIGSSRPQKVVRRRRGGRRSSAGRESGSSSGRNAGHHGPLRVGKKYHADAPGGR